MITCEHKVQRFDSYDEYEFVSTLSGEQKCPKKWTESCELVKGANSRSTAASHAICLTFHMPSIKRTLRIWAGGLLKPQNSYLALCRNDPASVPAANSALHAAPSPSQHPHCRLQARNSLITPILY